MSLITLSSLTFLPPQTLASLLRSPSSSKITIIDVRDSDHIGGHIKSSLWIPTADLDHRLPELVRTLKEQEKVVFHCALSQVRGPSSALRYARERVRLLGKEEVETGTQEVCVLEGGFSMWQARYGEDEGLTEAYVKDLWME